MRTGDGDSTNIKQLILKVAELENGMNYLRLNQIDICKVLDQSNTLIFTQIQPYLDTQNVKSDAEETKSKNTEVANVNSEINDENIM